MRRSLPLAAVLAVLAGCGTIEKLQNDKVLAGAVIATPSANVSGQTVPALVTAQVFFGDVPGGVTGAQNVQPLAADSAELVFTPPGGSAVTVPLAAVPGQAGVYEATSLTQPALAYHENVSYAFRVHLAGQTYSGSVTAPAKSELYSKNASPPPAYGTQLPALPATFDVRGLSLTPSYPLCRATSTLAFVSVSQVTTGGFGQPCSTPGAPTSASDVVRLIFDDSAYKATCFDVPASCFPSTAAGATYLVTLTSLAKSSGSAMSSNLFLGSAVFAGTSDAAAMLVTP
jgi:hypothetical protein